MSKGSGAWTAGMGLFIVAGLAWAVEPAPPGARETPTAGFVENSVCAECHGEQHQAWSGSHHDWAMRPAGEDTVLGDFDDARFTHFGVTSRFFRKDDKFFVNTEGPDGELADFEIAYTFGVFPLQQYLIPFPGGRLQSLTVAWDTRPEAQGGQRWFHLYPDERIAADDPLHWTGRYQNWNGQCAECHSTNLEKRYDPETDTYHTTWSAINVTCQACHGPGESHVTWARAWQAGQTTPSPGKGLLVDFSSGDARHQVDTCAPCHARRHQVSDENAPGRPLLDDFMPEALRSDLYHADGQILEEVYVYGSYLQSKMYQAGVRCTDCHDPHSLDPKLSGNAVCTQCHQQKPDPRFPALAAKAYDATAHHFHPPGSDGAQCVNCHMPAKNYMVVDPRRDHSLRIPRPDLSVKLGTPNACTGCHADQTDRWAADTVATWYGPQRRQEPHYGEVIGAGRAGAAGAESRLIALAENKQQPVIVRATALELLQGYGSEALRALAVATRDPEPLLRAMAIRGLERLPPEQRLALVAPRLTDPVRGVRTEAARVLASVPAERLADGNQRKAFAAALAEYREAQRARADMPAGRLNLGVLHTYEGEQEKAASAYRTAIEMDPYFLPARVNLANLYNAMGRNPDAERELREAIAQEPDQGELHYSLGLLLAEDGRLAESADALGQAAKRLPKRQRVHYNHALALQKLGRLEAAETAYLNAEALDRNNPDVLQALIGFYLQQRKWDQAYEYVERLAHLYPDAPEPQQLLRRLQVLKQYGVAPQ